MKRILFIPFLLFWCTSALAQSVMQWAGADPVIGPSYRTTSTPVLGATANVSGCTNSPTPYDTFDGASSSGFHAVYSTVGTQRAGTADEINLSSGILYSIKFTENLSSGTAPLGVFITDFGGAVRGSTCTTVSGSNSFWTFPTAADTVRFQFYSTVACEYTISDLAIKTVSLPSLLAPTRPFSGSGRFYTTATTANCATGEWLGTAAYVDDTRNPTKGVFAYLNRTTGNAELRVLTAANTWTSLINTAVTFSSGAQLVLVVDQDLMKAWLFYNNAIVGTAQDVSAYTWIKNNRRHAIFSTTAVTPGSVVYDYGPIVLQGDLFDAGAGTFESGTYGWIVYGTNTIANDANQLKITYVDNANGAKLVLSAASDLSSNLVVGGLYKISIAARVNAGSTVVPYVYTNAGNLISSINSETLATYSAYFVATSTNANELYTPNMGAGEIIWLDNLTLRRVQ